MRVDVDRSGLPLVGRSRELAAIATAIEAAASGSGGLVCIIGDAGIGKTRLAAEAERMARSAGFRCAWGSGWNEGGSPPLWPWPDIIEQLGQIDDPNIPTSTVPAGTRGDDLEAERFARFRSVARAISRSADAGPVLVVIDNAQAADDGALLLARFVVRSLPAARVLFVITARPGVSDGESGVRVALADITRDGVVLRPEPLSVPALRELVEDLGWTASEQRLDEVHRLTGGNPLFVTELVASTDGSQFATADSVRAIMALRTRQLGGEQQLLLEVVALLGPLARLPLIASVAGIDVDLAEADLRVAAETGVVVRDEAGRFRFAHDLMAEAALAACSSTRRSELHDAAAEALVAGGTSGAERAVAAAHHHLAAASLRRDSPSIILAAQSCRTAAVELVQRHAYEAAARLLSESIELHDQSGVTAPPDLLLDVARAELASGNLRGARPWFWRAADDADTPAQRAQAAVGLGGIWVDEHRGTIEHAAYMALIDRALDDLGETRPDLRARLVVRRSAEQTYLGHATAQTVREAVAGARAIGDPLVLAEALSLQHHTMLGPASAADRTAIADELVLAATAAGDDVLVVMGVLWRTVDLLLAGDPRAERSLNSLRERADALQIAAVLFVVSAIDVMHLLRKGMIVEAELAAQECFTLGSSIGDADAVGYYGAHLMCIRWLQCQPEDVLPLAREVAKSPTLVEGDVTYAVAVAALAAMAGEVDETRNALQRVMASSAMRAVATSSNWMVWMFCAIEAASRIGDVECARRVYDLLLPFRGQPIVGSLGVACFGSAERTLGLAAKTFGELDLAIEHLGLAVTANRQLGNEVVAAIAMGELGCALVERGSGTDRARGRVLIESAIALLDEFGLPIRVDDLRRFADAHSSEPVGRMRLEGGNWHLGFADELAVIPDSIGMQRLAMLLERPFADVPVADLVGGLEPSSNHDMIDAAALRAYRERISDLHADIDEADAHHDIVRAERMREELDALLEHIRQSASLGQRSRQFTSSQERARVAVRKSLSRVFDEVAVQSPRLGALLSDSVRTGIVCRFEPEDRLPALWERA